MSLSILCASSHPELKAAFSKMKKRFQVKKGANHALWLPTAWLLTVSYFGSAVKSNRIGQLHFREFKSRRRLNEYIELKNWENSCEQEGYHTVRDLNFCRSIVNSLAVGRIPTEREASTNYWPPGCSYRPSACSHCDPPKLYWNTMFDAQGECTGNNRCICFSGSVCANVHGEQPNPPSESCSCGTSICDPGSYCVATNSSCSDSSSGSQNQPGGDQELAFSIVSGECTASGACFYSQNYPNPYPRSQTCDIEIEKSGILKVVKFFINNWSDTMKIAGAEQNPSNLVVQKGSMIQFTSGQYGSEDYGFAICLLDACEKTTREQGPNLETCSCADVSRCESHNKPVCIAAEAKLNQRNQKICNCNGIDCPAGSYCLAEASACSDSKAAFVEVKGTGQRCDGVPGRGYVTQASMCTKAVAALKVRDNNGKLLEEVTTKNSEYYPPGCIHYSSWFSGPVAAINEYPLSATSYDCKDETCICVIAEPCLITNGTAPTLNICLCGSFACDSGTYCDTNTDQCNVHGPCQITNGSVANAMPCTCGTDECTATGSGLYCLISPTSGLASCRAEPSAMGFQKVTDGTTCTDVEGRGYIMDMASCVLGMNEKELGKGDVQLVKTKLSHYEPAGCFCDTSFGGQSRYLNPPIHGFRINVDYKCTKYSNCLCGFAPTCKFKAGALSNSHECLCGEVVCNRNSGLYCNAHISWCSVAPVCNNTNGLIVNGGAHCACANDECRRGTNGMYCYINDKIPHVGFCKNFSGSFGYSVVKYISDYISCDATLGQAWILDHDTCADAARRMYWSPVVQKDQYLSNGNQEFPPGCSRSATNQLSLSNSKVWINDGSNGGSCKVDNKLTECMCFNGHKCTFMLGKMQNTDACICGTRACTSHTGLYCLAGDSQNFGRAACFKEPVCSNQNGLAKNFGRCMCGHAGMVCENSFCLNGVCSASMPLTTCEVARKDPNKYGNSTSCLCGSRRCVMTPGLVCVMERSACSNNLTTLLGHHDWCDAIQSKDSSIFRNGSYALERGSICSLKEEVLVDFGMLSLWGSEGTGTMSIVEKHQIVPQMRLFHIEQGATLLISNVWLRGGNLSVTNPGNCKKGSVVYPADGGLVHVNQGGGTWGRHTTAFVAVNSVFSDGVARLGGAIHATWGSTIILRGSRFSRNKAYWYNNGQFSTCDAVAGDGGSIYLGTYKAVSTKGWDNREGDKPTPGKPTNALVKLQVTNCSFEESFAFGKGGAIAINRARIQLESSKIALSKMVHMPTVGLSANAEVLLVLQE